MADRFQLKALITGVDKLSPKLAGIQKNVAGFRKRLNNTGLGKIGIKQALAGGALAAPFVLGAKKAIDYETAMSSVRRVVKFETPRQFKQMSDDISEMSLRLPKAATEIAAIVAEGGQAGIARDELLGLAESAVKIGVAFGQTAEQSGEMVATWQGAFKLTGDGVVELADKINHVGGAHSNQIADVVTDIGAIGAISGVSHGQVAALGASMIGLGTAKEKATTGIKSFMQALTKGGAASKFQVRAFKALRLDPRKISKEMQKDSEGTMLKVLGRIRDIAPEHQSGLLTRLVGAESASPIAMLLTNLDVLKDNFQKVGDASKYTGSMSKEYARVVDTTAHNLQFLSNSADGASMSLGEALLPSINTIVKNLRPLINRVSALIKDNPNLVRGIAAAGLAFTAMSVGITAAVIATKILNPLLQNNPVIRIASLIALAAGLIVANWDAIAPYFKVIWDKIKGPAMVFWGWLKTAFSWTPLSFIIANWEPLTELFKAIWDVLLAISTPVLDFLKGMFSWVPLDMITETWGEIVPYFEKLWAKLKPIIEPIMKFFSGGEGGENMVKAATVKAKEFAHAQQQRNIGVGGGTGAFLQTNAVRGLSEIQAQRSKDEAQGRRTNIGLLTRRPDQAAPPGSLIQQTAASANRTNLQGSMVLRFENAPSNLRVESTETNQPGLEVTSKVGYRGLSQRG